MSLWRLQLFGTLRVEGAETVITRYSTQKAAALLAYLGLHLPRRFPREVLIDLLWPECELSVGRNRLSYTLSTLRRQLEPPPIPSGAVLVTTNADIGLNPDTVQTDVEAFERLQRASEQAATDTERLSLLLNAMELYRGELLPGFYHDWAASAQQRLSISFVEVAGQAARLLEQTGEQEQALGCALRALEADSLQEATHYAVMRLYASLGRTAEALQQYATLSRMLQEEYQAAPSAPVQKFATWLRTHPVPVQKSDAPSDVGLKPTVVESSPPRLPSLGGVGLFTSWLPTESGGWGGETLPTFLTRFFGQEAALNTLSGWLCEEGKRLVTLTGPGGSGKTRLATECARQVAPHFENVVTFVPLVEVTEASRIPDAILTALRLPRSPQLSPIEQVASYLASRSALLLLDNFDALVEEGAALLQTLLERAPALCCLVTSRRLLGLSAEQELAAPLLPLPPLASSPNEMAEYACVRLFVDRVQAKRPAFQVTAKNAPAVAELMQRLEGVPLAIELAAAQMRTGTLARTLAQLEKRLDGLTSPHRDTPERHRTLRAAIEGNYRLLEPEARRFFAGLSVFRGGWTAEAAQAVTASVNQTSRKDTETQRDSTTENTGDTEREILTLLREHSLILAEEDDGEIRYRMLEMLREFGAEQLTALEQQELTARHADYFTRFAEEQEPRIHGPEQIEALNQLEREHDNFRAALRWSLVNHPQNALQLTGALFWFWQLHSYLREGREWLEQALLLTDARQQTCERARALQGMGHLLFYSGQYAEALPYLAESVQMWRDLNHETGLLSAMVYYGVALALTGEDDGQERAIAVFNEGKALAQRQKDSWYHAAIAWMGGVVYRDHGDHATSARYYDESYALFQEIGDSWGIGSAGYYVAEDAYRKGEKARAQELIAEYVSLNRAIGDRWRMAAGLDSLGEFALAEGDLDTARRLFAESLFFCQEMCHSQRSAHELRNLGQVARLAGDYTTARRYYLESLELYRALPYPRGVVNALDSFGCLAAAQGQMQRAALLFGVTDALRTHLKLLIPPTEQADHQRAVANARQALSEADWEEAYQRGQGLSQEEAVAFAQQSSGFSQTLALCQGF